jgi:hypothetical protein
MKTAASLPMSKAHVNRHRYGRARCRPESAPKSKFSVETGESAARAKAYTSGVGGVFPPGLLIGNVKDFALGIGRTAQLVPAVDLTKLEDVFVVVGRK